MPLIKSKSDKAFKHNLKAEMHAGKPQAQSLAIAYDVQRRSKARKKMAEGGKVSPTPTPSVMKDEELMPPHKPVTIDVPAPPRQKMAEGGEVDQSPEERMRARLKGFLGAPKAMASGGMYAEGGEVREHASESYPHTEVPEDEAAREHEEAEERMASGGLVDKIRAAQKAMMAAGGEVASMELNDAEEPAGEEFEEQNELAVEEHMENEEEEQHHDRVARMRRMMKAKQGY